MHDYIPFVGTNSDAKLVAQLYQDASIARVPLNNLSNVTPNLPSKIKLWIDPTIDGLSYTGKLVLPVILTHSRQTEKKTERKKKIDATRQAISKCGADGLWVVDESLNDMKIQQLESVEVTITIFLVEYLVKHCLGPP